MDFKTWDFYLKNNFPSDLAKGLRSINPPNPEACSFQTGFYDFLSDAVAVGKVEPESHRRNNAYTHISVVAGLLEKIHDKDLQRVHYIPTQKARDLVKSVD